MENYKRKRRKSGKREEGEIRRRKKVKKRKRNRSRSRSKSKEQRKLQEKLVKEENLEIEKELIESENAGFVMNRQKEEEDFKKRLEERRRKRNELLKKLEEKKPKNEEKIEEKKLKNEEKIEERKSITEEKNEGKMEEESDSSSQNDLNDDLQEDINLDFSERIIEKEEPAPQPKKEEEEIYDMFGSSSSEDGEGSKSKLEPQNNLQFVRNDQDLDDEEFYYKAQLGEVINKDFKIVEKLGKGVYGSVVKAEQISTGKLVAIKILRNAEILTRAGEREWKTVTLLNNSDPFDKKHILRFLGKFNHKNHLCIVSELLTLNMRDAISMYGKRVGLSLPAVRSYAYQLFMALYHLKKNRIVHLDIKPDNMMITKENKKCKMIDFGNAMSIHDVPQTSELVARFYRAPEIILGLQLGYPIDMWSTACSIFEMYTGELLFDGESDNAMLKQMMILKGPFTSKMLRKGQFVADHFDLNTNQFMSLEKDKDYVKYMTMGSLTKKGIKERLGMDNDEYAKNSAFSDFKDLMEKILHLDPDRRLTPEEAIRHRFFQSARKKRKRAKKKKSQKNN